MPLSEGFDQALLFASDLHRDQIRKGANIPYMSHLLSVAALVIECGGNEKQAIAGLLHDTLEDCSEQFGGGKALAAVIEERFGADVRRMVEGCTDAEAIPKPPWQERKNAYLSAIPSKAGDTLLVACCDKLHNARCILHDLEELGPAVFDRFSSSVEQTLWYYQSLAKAFQDALGSNARSARLLAGRVAQIVKLSEADPR